MLFELCWQKRKKKKSINNIVAFVDTVWGRKKFLRENSQFTWYQMPSTMGCLYIEVDNSRHNSKSILINTCF